MDAIDSNHIEDNLSDNEVLRILLPVLKNRVDFEPGAKVGYKSNMIYTIDTDTITDDRTFFATNFTKFPSMLGYIRVILGSFTQSNTVIFDKQNAGMQCAGISLIAVLVAKELNVQLWTSAILDWISLSGDRLYHNSFFNENHKLQLLYIDENIPREFKVFQKKYQIQFDTGKYTSIDQMNYLPVLRGLEWYFEINHDDGGSVFGVDGYFVTIIKNGNEFYYFDSHTRPTMGFTGEPKSFLIKVPKLRYLAEILVRNFRGYDLSIDLETMESEINRIDEIRKEKDNTSMVAQMHAVKIYYIGDARNEEEIADATLIQNKMPTSTAMDNQKMNLERIIQARKHTETVPWIPTGWVPIYIKPIAN